MKLTAPGGAAIGAILLAAVAVIAAPLTATAFHRGGGFHGGGFHRGGFHHGGFRGGGGRIRHGFRAGRYRTGRFGPGGFRSGGFSRHGFHAPGLNDTPGFHGPWRGHGPFATRLSPGFSRHAFMRDGFHGYHRFGVFGWVGPVFWPYAFSDINCGVYWGYWGAGCADPNWSAAYGNPFWDYGYGDIYGGLFSPFTFGDLAPYLPNGPSSVREARTKGATATAVAQMCGADTGDIAGWPIDRIRDLVSPDDKQRALLDALASATVKAAQIIKDGCPASVAFTPPGRLAAMQRRIEAMRKAVETVRGPLDAFYDSLTDEQKAKFTAAGEPPASGSAGRHGTAQSCAAANALKPWPQAQIETALHPDEAQQAKLKALQDAAARAAEQLAASCPAESPVTPSARLAAISKRLDALLTAVKTVRSALDDFYGALNDEQKARLNRIGLAHTAERQD